MPLLDHFHPPLHGPRHWEGFLHAWASLIAHQLNQETLPPGYFAEPEVTLGPTLEVDGATLESTGSKPSADRVTTAVWSPPRPKITAQVDFSRMDSIEVRVYQDLGGADLRAAVELVSPANKDRKETRLTFAAKCAGYLRHGIGIVIVDVVTSRSANLHDELFQLMEIKSRRATWRSPSGLYVVSYRAVTERKRPRIEAWPVALGKVLPVLPLWLDFNLYVPLPLEQSYTSACGSLRIPA
jgi:hypothetical protein